MSGNNKAVASRGGQFAGIALALLALSIFINYVDRGNLATAAPLIRSDLRLSNVEYGLLVSAFFWVYVPGQIIAEPPFREILSNRQLWGASIGHFCANYPLYMVLSWLPLYLVKSQGFSISAMAQLGGVVYGLATLICLAGGWLADRWIAAGAATSRVRLAMICSVGLIWFVCMMACGLGNAAIAIAALLISSVAMGLGHRGRLLIADVQWRGGRAILSPNPRLLGGSARSSAT